MPLRNILIMMMVIAATSGPSLATAATQGCSCKGLPGSTTALPWVKFTVINNIDPTNKQTIRIDHTEIYAKPLASNGCSKDQATELLIAGAQTTWCAPGAYPWQLTNPSGGKGPNNDYGHGNLPQTGSLTQNCSDYSCNSV